MNILRRIVLCIAPYAVSGTAMYLMGAFVAASWNLTDWERTDRVFCAICVFAFGTMLLFRLEAEEENEAAQRSYLGLDKAPKT